MNNNLSCYFVVVNKMDTNYIIVNSIKGLIILPFQICWNIIITNLSMTYFKSSRKYKIILKYITIYI